MADVARSRQYSVWLDREQPVDTSSDSALADYLRAAMANCLYVIFFETVARMAAVVNGPAVREISWQERELGYVEAGQLIVLYHSQLPPRYGLGVNRYLCPYNDLNNALDKIEDAMNDTDLFISQRSPCGYGGTFHDAQLEALRPQTVLGQFTDHGRSASAGQ